MKLTKNIPDAIRGRFIFAAVRRFLILAAVYAVLYYSIIDRFGYEYFALRIGVLPTVLIYAALILLPPLLLRIPAFFNERAWEGEVLEVERKRDVTIWAGGANFMVIGFSSYTLGAKDQWRTEVNAKIRLDNGKVIKRRVRNYSVDDNTSLMCQPGDRVRHFKGAKYNQIFGRGTRHDVDCIWCGHYTRKENDYCDKCGIMLFHWPVDTTISEVARVENEVLREHEAKPDASRAQLNPQHTVRINEPAADTMSYSAPRPVRHNGDADFEIGEVAKTPEFGTYKRKVELMDVMETLFYIGITYVVTSFISATFDGPYDNTGRVLGVYTVFSLIIPLALSVFFIKDLPTAQFRASGKIPAWLRQGLITLVPIELIRTLVSFIGFGSLFAPIAHILWQYTYVLPADRVQAMYEETYIMQDYTSYAALAFATMAVRLVVLLAAYAFFWFKHRKSLTYLDNIKAQGNAKF